MSGTLNHLAPVKLPANNWAVGSLRSCSTTSVITGTIGSAIRADFSGRSHVVHHQSEEFNLTTALRQTSTGNFFRLDVLYPSRAPAAFRWSFI